MEKTPSLRVQSFGSYYLLERIAVGGMAEIFKAKQVGVRGFEKIVVIKKILQQLSSDPEFVGMFEHEAKVAAQLQQNNIAQIYELGEVDGVLYITMELVEGRNLRDVTQALISKGAHLSIEQCIYIISEFLKGLDYAHRKKDSRGQELKIIHRDVSPQNIIVSYEGEVKILDFGIAKAASQVNQTEAGVLKGKFSYMSPEQASGKEVDQTTDIYACGVILHELVTSKRLFRCKSDMETLEKVKAGIVPHPSSFNPQIDAELDRIILKALQKKVSDRYVTASDMLLDINQWTLRRGTSATSQDLSAFMKTLFKDQIREEHERLQIALSQIPANPEDGLKEAKTHIAFKADPSKKMNAEDYRDRTFTSMKPASDFRSRVIILLTTILILVIGFIEWSRPESILRNLFSSSSDINNEDSSLPDLVVPEPSLKDSDKPADKLNLEVVPPPSEESVPSQDAPPAFTEEPLFQETPPEESKKISEAATASESPEPKKEEIKTPKKEVKKKSTPKASTKKGKGKIDMVAPIEGFAKLFIDDQDFGTVPGPKARGLSLTEGLHSIRCETSTKVYSGKIKVIANKSITVKCQELK